MTDTATVLAASLFFDVLQPSSCVEFIHQYSTTRNNRYCRSSIINTKVINLKISNSDLKKLFNFATSQTHFLFKGQIYDQIDGVAMGSPLAPVLANLFMGYFEDKWLKSYNGEKPAFYKRYVDDIFAAFTSKNHAD
ncbi:uncharacterized protein LOC136075913 [Hydra vulgaris]|uniref:Uncharacterized protein LOC136075913 n=1 Tax=Hydra vulgaris TaxID=6087 RepID=A0ABM4B963_HYDVU